MVLTLFLQGVHPLTRAFILSPISQFVTHFSIPCFDPFFAPIGISHGLNKKLK